MQVQELFDTIIEQSVEITRLRRAVAELNARLEAASRDASPVDAQEPAPDDPEETE